MPLAVKILVIFAFCFSIAVIISLAIFARKVLKKK